HPRHRSRNTIKHQGAFPGKRMLMTGNSLIRDRRRATKLLRVSGHQLTRGWFVLHRSINKPPETRSKRL
ncbi:TPA: hypothetical protein ACHTJ8_005229, partial [Escherichia coli]